MGIEFPNISPAVMKKYPLYVLIAFLSTLATYFINNSLDNQNKVTDLLKLENRVLVRKLDSLQKENSDFKDALLRQHGIIQDYKNVVTRTDSLANKKIGKPIKELKKLAK